MSDLIDRQAAINALERKKDKNAKGDIGGFYNKIIQTDIDTLMQLPSAQPRKKGRWINGKCSECGEPQPISKVFDRGELVWDRETHINYCNNCGAEMEKGEE